MAGIAQHIGCSVTPPMATRDTVAPGAPKIPRTRVAIPKTGNDSPPRSILNAVKALLTNKDASVTDVFTNSSNKLPGSLLGPFSLAGVVYDNKSKEIDSGVIMWETTNYDPIATHRQSTVKQPANGMYIPAGIFLDRTKMYDSTPLYQKRLEHFISELKVAQMVYPARFSVFVGNLPAQFNNEVLTRMVIALFRRYGKVYGVVTRSKTFTAEKPWAILQFTKLEHATNAVNQVSRTTPDGHEIVDRTIRTAFCEAKRNIFIWSYIGLQHA